jgi:hypothetical protein
MDDLSDSVSIKKGHNNSVSSDGSDFDGDDRTDRDRTRDRTDPSSDSRSGGGMRKIPSDDRNNHSESTSDSKYSKSSNSQRDSDDDSLVSVASDETSGLTRRQGADEASTGDVPGGNVVNTAIDLPEQRKPPKFAFSGNYYLTNLSENGKDQALIDIGIEHFGLVVGSPILKWNMRNAAWRHPKRQPNTAISKWRCAFHIESKCEWCVQIEHNMSVNTYSIEIGSIPHSNHNISGRKRGVPRAVLAKAFSSPGKVHDKPSNVVARVHLPCALRVACSN